MGRPLGPTSCVGRAAGLSLARLFKLTRSGQLPLQLLTSKMGQSLSGPPSRGQAHLVLRARLSTLRDSCRIFKGWI